MNKADIVEKIRDGLGYTKYESVEFMESTLRIIKDALCNGEHVKISGFGKFEVRSKAQRQGRNPVTGEPMAITPRKVLSFKSSIGLKKLVNRDGQGDIL